MNALNVKPSDKLVKEYYAALGQYSQLQLDHEGTVRSAFQAVLRGYGKKLEWTLAPEYPIQVAKGKRIIVDGALLDTWKFRHGFWEAKDEHDDLEREIKIKIEKGYPRSNIIFQAPERAILYQKGVRQGLNEDISDPKNLSALLNEFFAYREPDHDEWEAAVREVKERIPELAQRAEQIIEGERKANRAFRERFEAFYDLCRQAINPNLSAQAVEKMLIQHLLTERIFRRIFRAEEFRTRNVIAAEIEKVIQSLTARQFSRDQFLSDLDRFYKAIERAADGKDDYSEKQAFLNTVYERFFQGFSPKEADTHGIVYTPQPIVDFMVRSVDDILKKEFGKTLADKDVHILDPFVGTGNFITRVMKQIGETRKSALPHKYKNELHCNEIMLLPYYIASMNIEHEYAEQTGQYEPFAGICLVDTFELAEPEQAALAFMSEENTARVKRQKQSPIFVIIGNPPYNIGQVDENDNNRNRKYPEIDRRIAATFVKDSRATLTNSLFDPYFRAFRWATDRIGEDGIIAFVMNNGFLDGLAADGFRKHMAKNFDSIYILDLGGNVRKNPKLSGSTHNVFGIQVGVSINIFVRNQKGDTKNAKVFAASVDEFWTRYQKYTFLEEKGTSSHVEWNHYRTNSRGDWLPDGAPDDFARFISIGSKEAKRGTESSIFHTYCNGQKSNSDEYIYSFSREVLVNRAKVMVDSYSSEMDRWKRAHCPEPVDGFIEVDVTRLKWIRHTKRCLSRRVSAGGDQPLHRLPIALALSERVLQSGTWQREGRRRR